MGAREKWKGIRARLTDRFKLIAVSDEAADLKILKRGSLADILQFFGGRCTTGGPAGSWFLHDGFRVVARIVPETDRRLSLRELEEVGPLADGDVLVRARMPLPRQEQRGATISIDGGSANDKEKRKRRHDNAICIIRGRGGSSGKRTSRLV